MKRKHQKGAGFLNFFRRTRRQPPATAAARVPAPNQALSLPAVVPTPPANTRSRFRKFMNRFTRKRPAQVAPVQPQNRPVFNRRPAQLPSESVTEALNRIMVFFFRKHFPAEADRYPPNALQLSEEDHARLVRDFRAFYNSLPENEDLRLQRTATEFFHSPSLGELDQEISIEEIGTPNNRKIINRNTTRARTSFTACGNLGRCISALQSFPRELEYIGNTERFISPILPIAQPISNFNSQRPISVFRSIEDLNVALNNYPIDTWIVLKPEFVRGHGNIKIAANKFTQASFIQDAFEQEGVLKFDPHLFAALEDRAPQFLQKAEIKLAPADEIENPEIVNGKFMIFEDIALPARRTYIYPVAEPSIKRALQNGSVILTDPITMYVIRKDNPTLWRTCFNDANMEGYQRLTPIEQLTFCFIQYVAIFKRYLQFKGSERPRDAIRSATSLLSISLSRPDIIPAYLEEFEDTDSLEWQELRRLTRKIANRSTNINTVENIQELLSKILEGQIELRPVAGPSQLEMNVEQLQTRISQLNANLRGLNERRRQTRNNRGIRVLNQQIRRALNNKMGLQTTLEMRLDAQRNSLGRPTGTRRKFSFGR